MKKFLIAFVAIVTAFTIGVTKAHSQVTNLVSQYSNTVDTVTTAVKYLSYGSAISGYKKFVTIQFKITENSAVTTAGTAQIQSSLDGVDWYDIDSSAYQKTKVNLSDAASKTYELWAQDWKGLYLRLAVTPTGTLADKIYAKFLVRTP